MVLPEESNHSFCLNLIIMGKMRYTRPLAKLQNFLNPKLPKKLCSSLLLLTQVSVLCGSAGTCAVAAMHHCAAVFLLVCHHHRPFSLISSAVPGTQ